MKKARAIVVSTLLASVLGTGVLAASTSDATAGPVGLKNGGWCCT